VGKRAKKSETGKSRGEQEWEDLLKDGKLWKMDQK